MDNNFIVEEKIDRLEAHFKEFRKDAVIDRELNKDVRTALIGSNLNGNKGIVNLLDSVDSRLKSLENQQTLDEEMKKQMKYASGTIFAGFISYLIWLFSHK